MILPQAILVVVAMALLLRRDVTAIGRVAFRGGRKFAGVVVGLFVLQAVTVLYAPGQSFWQVAILATSQLLLAILFLINHHLPGARLFALGIAFNILVMVANSGWMPVTPEMYHSIHPERAVALYARPPSSKNIVLPRSETAFWLLSDVIRIALPWRRTAVSVGDLFLVLGVVRFIFWTTAPQNRAGALRPHPQPPRSHIGGGS
ncbi:MAG: DUF5317 family protein [Anaerolineae bacterium]